MPSEALKRFQEAAIKARETRDESIALINRKSFRETIDLIWAIYLDDMKKAKKTYEEEETDVG